MTVTADTITPEMLRSMRSDAIAHPDRYPNYRNAVIRYTTWALGESDDVAGVDCTILAGAEENYRLIALDESVRAWNWRTTEDAKTGERGWLSVVAP